VARSVPFGKRIKSPVSSFQDAGVFPTSREVSRWRREASERIPELQPIIASKEIDGPMMLWIELNQEFEKLCRLQPPPVDLLRRVWQYCDWCLLHGNDDVRTAAALGFCEHLIDTPERVALLPKIMTRSDFIALRNFPEYHHSPAAVDACLKSLWR
jgi:hypothetical protein